MLELDVGVTKDGQVVVMHDTTVDRTTNGHGTVASFTLKQLRKLDAAYWFSGGSNAYRHDRARSAYRLRGVATGKRKPPKGFTAADFRVPTLKEVLQRLPAHADQRRDQGPHEGRGARRVPHQRRRARADAEVAPRAATSSSSPSSRRPSTASTSSCPRCPSRPASAGRPTGCWAASHPATASSPSSCRSPTSSAARRCRSRPRTTSPAPTARATPGTRGSATTARARRSGAHCSTWASTA